MKVLIWLSIGLDRRSPSFHLLCDIVEQLVKKECEVFILQKDTGGDFDYKKYYNKKVNFLNVKMKLPKVDKNGNMEQKYVNDKFKDVRIGAFEVQLGFKKFGQGQKTALLHSKLQTRQFPVIIKILDKIVSYLPTFSGKIITYEKEDKDMTSENNKENNNGEGDIYKKGLMEGLQINIYLLNNSKIIKIAKEAWNDIQNQQDPHKRQILIKEDSILLVMRLSPLCVLVVLRLLISLSSSLLPTTP